MRADFPYVYPLSRSEALRRDETQMHEDSFRENVKCAWDIEKAVRDCSDEGRTALTEGCAQSVLEAYGFKRVRFVLSNSLGEMAQPRQISEEARQWAREIYVPPDGKRNRCFAVKTSAPLLEAFIRQTQAAYQALGLFGQEHCAGGFARVSFVLAGSLNRHIRNISDKVSDWSMSVKVPYDPKYTSQFMIHASDALLDAFVRQVWEARQKLGLYGMEHCAGETRRDCSEFFRFYQLRPTKVQSGHIRPKNSLWQTVSP